MKLLGREFPLALTVGAMQEISALCPNGDLTRLKEVFERSPGDITEFFIHFIASLSKAAEQRRAFLEPGYEPQPATPEMLRLMTREELEDAKADAMRVWAADKKPTVETSSKKNEGSTPEISGST